MLLVLYQEWWDSLFKPSASEDSTQLSQRVEHSPARLSAPAESRDPAASCESVKSTAAVLRLSDALQRAPRSQTDGVSTAQYSSLSGFSFNFSGVMLCISADYAVTRYPSVRLSITRRYSVETAKCIIKLFHRQVATPF